MRTTNRIECNRKIQLLNLGRVNLYYNYVNHNIVYDYDKIFRYYKFYYLFFLILFYKHCNN